MSILNLLLVGSGGFFGAIARFSITQFINQKYASKFPAATLLINLLGSFLLGLMFGLGIGGNALLLLGTGFMGAFTTFSTFTLEGTQLFMEKSKKAFLLYNAFSYAGGIGLAFLGLILGRLLA